MPTTNILPGDADFSIPPVRSLAGLTATVVGTSQLSDQLIRVTLTSPEVAATDFSVCTDRYVKLEFATADGPVRRSYTIRNFDRAAGTIDIDFVVHGTEGVAGPWAATARPGDTLVMGGVGGGYRPAPHAPWHLLVGDESALPAIAAALEEVPKGAQVHAYIEIADATQTIDLAHPVTWVPRDGAPYGVTLLAKVLELDLPAQPGHVFLHGEAGMVRELRRHLRAHGYPMSAMRISGYWRAGATDEMWRAQKRDWKQQVDQDEQTLTSQA